MLKIKIEIQN